MARASLPIIIYKYPLGLQEDSNFYYFNKSSSITGALRGKVYEKISDFWTLIDLYHTYVVLNTSVVLQNVSIVKPILLLPMLVQVQVVDITF